MPRTCRYTRPVRNDADAPSGRTPFAANAKVDVTTAGTTTSTTTNNTNTTAGTTIAGAGVVVAAAGGVRRPAEWHLVVDDDRRAHPVAPIYRCSRASAAFRGNFVVPSIVRSVGGDGWWEMVIGQRRARFTHYDDGDGHGGLPNNNKSPVNRTTKQ